MSLPISWSIDIHKRNNRNPDHSVTTNYNWMTTVWSLENVRLISPVGMKRVKLLTKPWFPISLNPKLLHSGSRAVWPCQAQWDVKKQFYCFCFLVIVSISVCTQGNWWKKTSYKFSYLTRHCYTTRAHHSCMEKITQLPPLCSNTRKSSMLTSQLYFGYCPVWVDLISGLLQVAYLLKITISLIT